MAIRFKVTKAKGKSYAAIVENYRDPKDGSSRTRCIKSYGNLDELKKQNPKIEEELKAEAERLNADSKERRRFEQELPCPLTLPRRMRAQFRALFPSALAILFCVRSGRNFICQVLPPSSQAAAGLAGTLI